MPSSELPAKIDAQKEVTFPISEELIRKIDENNQHYRKNLMKLKQNSLKSFWLELGFAMLILLSLAIIARYLAKFN